MVESVKVGRGAAPADLSLWSIGRVCAVAALCAALAYAGSLWNGFAGDDFHVIQANPLVHAPTGLWRAFGQPYWEATLYRPLTMASYSLDWMIGGPAWFHAVNVCWQAGVAALVAWIAYRWAGASAALVAGVLFAVHPVHVEAVANVVGRAELMATAFSLLALYGAVAGRSAVWTAAAWGLGLLSKETAAVAPALVAMAWAADLGPRPDRGRLARLSVAWGIVGAAYVGARELVLHSSTTHVELAPVFAGATFLGVRLTALSALPDVVRLLLAPLTLRADYSPAERVAATGPLDPLVLAGVAIVVLGALAFVRLWKRGRRLEAYGLAWIAVAFLPVANLVFPTGVFIAERTLYLPSVGLALAVGSWARNLAGSRLWGALVVLGLAGGIRTAMRVPVWRSGEDLVFSILEDSPRSYVGPLAAGAIYLQHRQDARAVTAFDSSRAAWDRDPRTYMLEAHALLALGGSQVARADSLLSRMASLCGDCRSWYDNEILVARSLGQPAVAESLLAREGRRRP